MSYQNWANFDWIIPATIDKVRELGVDDSQFEELWTLLPNETWEDVWNDFITEVAIDGHCFCGKIDDVPFNINLIYINSEAELDGNMDAQMYCYMSFNMEDLFIKTPLYLALEKRGMELHSWVEGG